MATYQELKAQAEDLLRQAEAARKTELAVAVAEIKAKMAEHGITLADLGGTAKQTSSRATAPIKYRNPATGATWSGRGRLPRWFADELARGRKREEFLIRDPNVHGAF
ncbi:H-NS family nucleoid-associated regulatory protein [Sulfuritalea sp.]|uniref:H-NS histone family protein n=1 Tax=Sulfuritalea sp. TaxID=2480090 RepID=UPI00391B623C